MDTRNRWRALVLGAGYLLIGLMGWVRSGTSWDAPVPSDMVLLALWGATAILALGIARPTVFHLGGVGSGPWLALAIAAPLSLVPLRNGDASAAIVLVLAWPLSALPLGIALGNSPERPDANWPIAAGLAATAIVLGLPAYFTDVPRATLGTLQTAAVAGTTFVPALLAARRIRGSPGAQEARVLVGLAPLIGAVVLAAPSTGLIVLAVTLLVIALVNRVSLRPLVQATTLALAQRDLTVAAVEAERQRLAMDIHDGALQSVLLLGRQLEQDGHTEAAASARSIATELRDVAGALRLPLLDDLGVGPALEWLAERARRTSGALITVETRGTSRPPADVELASFRIAQEAVANAIRHGESPIVIRYTTTGTHVSLCVEDAGGGFPNDAARSAGSHGLLNMAQRAEQIGASLEFLQLPTRGMQVAVEWPVTS